MNITEIKTILKASKTIAFKLPNGTLVPAHFHVTEIGKVHKDFIDCGGKRRQESKISFQLWEENDYDHRLHPEKLVSIIELAERQLGLADEIIEVEYQGDTIGKYNLEHDGQNFILAPQQTACLAKENCVPAHSEETMMSLGSECTPGGGCC